MISFFVPGTPIAQPRHRFGNYGAYIKSDHPIHAWKDLIMLHCNKCVKIPFTGAIRVYTTFFFNRPKTHYNTKGLRDNAPDFKSTNPDIDNLQKAVFDAMEKASVFKNDSQIAHVSVSKRYDSTPGVMVRIEKI